MGLTVRSVFLKSRSSHDSHARRKWSTSVRSYLCGDELNSVLAAEDSASMRSSTVAEADMASFSRGGGDISSEEDGVSVKSSEATVNQPLLVESKDENGPEKLNSTYRLFRQEDAALIIQSAYRRFRATRARDGAKKHESAETPSRDSVGTSVEVQTGNSSDFFSIEESFRVAHKMRHRTRAQVLKIQEDWDDSTVSSVISKMRLQNRLEAATRRERALAYAFSQQLRICSRKKPISVSGTDGTNTGWSWLERWMAARQPEITLADDGPTGPHKALVRKRMLDAAMDERESCGSNEVSSLIGIGNLSVPRPPKSRSKANKSFSRQNSASSHLCPRESKDVKKMCHMEDEKEKRERQKQPGNKKDVKYPTNDEEQSNDIWDEEQSNDI